jgi:hypothetical protein
VEAPSRRRANVYDPRIPEKRYSRHDRAEYMKLRRASLAASRSKRRTDSPETHSVGLNQGAEWVGTDTHDLPPDLFLDPSGSVHSAIDRVPDGDKVLARPSGASEQVGHRQRDESDPDEVAAIVARFLADAELAKSTEAFR